MIGSEWVLYWPVGALPYGVGTRQDGRVTLLNWFGEPIWDRWPDGRVTRADRDETGIEFVSEETFETEEPDDLTGLLRVLVEFGVRFEIGLCSGKIGGRP
jgi:hypothetical protein